MSSPSFKNQELYHNLEGVTIVSPLLTKNKGSASSEKTKCLPKTHKCRMCHEFGHNSRSCKMKTNKGKQIKNDDNIDEE